jgi:hypothetical protein
MNFAVRSFNVKSHGLIDGHTSIHHNSKSRFNASICSLWEMDWLRVMVF